MIRMNTLYIYALRDPSDGGIRYVGKTNDLAKRLHNHRFSAYRNKNARLYDWIHSLASRPLVTVLSVCDEKEWGAREIEWIAYLRSIGVELCNISIGGAGPYLGQPRSHSESAKAKLREANRLQFADPQKKQRHSDAVKVWFASLPEEKQEHLRGVGRTELAKHRDRGRQRKLMNARWNAMTPEQREQFIEFRARRSRETMTPEKRAHLSAASVKTCNDPGWRESHRQSKKNDWARLTPEQYEDRCARIRAGKAARKAREAA